MLLRTGALSSAETAVAGSTTAGSTTGLSFMSFTVPVVIFRYVLEVAVPKARSSLMVFASATDIVKVISVLSAALTSPLLKVRETSSPAALFCRVSVVSTNDSAFTVSENTSLIFLSSMSSENDSKLGDTSSGTTFVAPRTVVSDRASTRSCLVSVTSPVPNEMNVLPALVPNAVSRLISFKSFTPRFTTTVFVSDAAVSTVLSTNVRFSSSTGSAPVLADSSVSAPTTKVSREIDSLNVIAKVSVDKSNTKESSVGLVPSGVYADTGVTASANSRGVMGLPFLSFAKLPATRSTELASSMARSASALISLRSVVEMTMVTTLFRSLNVAVELPVNSNSDPPVASERVMADTTGMSADNGSDTLITIVLPSMLSSNLSTVGGVVSGVSPSTAMVLVATDWTSFATFAISVIRSDENEMIVSAELPLPGVVSVTKASVNLIVSRSSL